MQSKWIGQQSYQGYNQVSNQFVCGFCQRDFRNERTLGAHMCPVKRRHLEKDTVASRMALELYRRFFELTTASKKSKTFEDFAASKYYVTFIKLARHLMDLRPVEQDRFIDYLFMNGIKERNWCKDSVYEKYIIDLFLTENPDRALERSIETIVEWANTNHTHFSKFFSEVSANEATQLLRYGRISPWVFYLANTADQLISRLSAEHDQLISKTVDIKAWYNKFNTKVEQREYVKSILDEAGL